MLVDFACLLNFFAVKVLSGRFQKATQFLCISVFQPCMDGIDEETISFLKYYITTKIVYSA